MDKQYKARNKEDGQIYYLRPVHRSKPDMYFVFKHPHFSDQAYCGAGYCHHYEILEEYPIGDQPHAKVEMPQPSIKVDMAPPPPPKPKQMNLLEGLATKAKPVQLKLF